MHIKKNDEIVVITGKDKGKKGKVIEVLPKKGKVRVNGVNMVKKHQKATQGSKKKSGIIEVEALINSSNVMLLFKGKPTRVGYKVNDGKKIRIARSTGEEIG